MKIINMIQLGDWQLVRNVARLTQGKGPIFTPVSEDFKRKMIISRHEPLKLLNYVLTIECPQWVTGHFVRHKHSLHFVESSRSDLTGRSRDPERIIQYVCTANPVGLMDMAEKRLCARASEETRQTMQLIVEEIQKVEPFLASRLKPACVVKGYCPEQFSSCGFIHRDAYQIQRDLYLQDIE